MPGFIYGVDLGYKIKFDSVSLYNSRCQQVLMYFICKWSELTAEWTQFHINIFRNHTGICCVDVCVSHLAVYDIYYMLVS